MFESYMFLHNKLFEKYGVEFHVYDGIYSKKHDHEGYWELFMIIDGKALHNYSDAPFEVGVNYVQLMRPKDVHSFRSLGVPCRHLSISFDKNIVKSMLDAVDAELYRKIIEYPGAVAAEFSDGEREAVLAKLKEYTLMPEAKNHSISIELKFMFLSILEKLYTALFPENTGFPAVVGEAINFMQTHYQESISVGDICANLGCTHITLLRQFKQHTGQTVIGYLLDLKLEKAFSLLVSTDRKVIDVCNAVGIYSVSYFNKKFKEKYGFSPTKLKHG